MKTKTLMQLCAAKESGVQGNIKRMSRYLGLGVVLALAYAGNTTAFGQNYSVLRDFAGADGQLPYGGVLLADGVLYGTAQSGGAGYGVVFRLQTDGSGFAVLKSFDSAPGGFPHAELALGNNVLYGVASGVADIGGVSAIFKLNIDGSGFSNLMIYQGGMQDGLEQVILNGGVLYGTSEGAANYGKVFRLNTNGSGYAVLKTFSGADGQYPEAALVCEGSTLYGTTTYGGNPGPGVVFSLNTDGSGFRVLKSLGGSEGTFPHTLLLADGTLYGLTGGGGRWNSGTLFKLNTDGSGFIILKNFTGSDGQNPHGLVHSAGTLYGTADGGTFGRGLIFMIRTNGSDFTILKQFEGPNGAYPLGKLAFGEGTLYGTTREGGQSNVGVVYSLALTPPGRPIIISQPQGLSAHAGTNVTFTVLASGNGILSYQWHKDTSPISGATSSTLTLTNVQLADVGAYSVAVSNGFGPTLSQDALLVVEDPFVEAYPAYQIINAGGTLRLDVIGGGTPPLSYQWFREGVRLRDGGNISGAQSATLIIRNACDRDTGHYWVEVSNAHNTSASPAALVTVKVAGTIISWGHQKMPFVPAGTRFQSIASGSYHNLALKRDGTVLAWGVNEDSYGACPLPDGLAEVVSIAAGDGHNLALKADGSIVAWGYDYYGQASVPPELSGTRVTAIAAGYHDSFAIKADGTVVAWGVWAAVHNAGTLPPVTVPDDLRNVIAVSAGGEHALALKQDGTVVAWGLNSYGQTNVPPELSGTRVVAIAAGAFHNLALKENGTVIAWGQNLYGETDVPDGLHGVIAIAANYAHSLALKQDGTVVGWGAGRIVYPGGGIQCGQSIVPGDLRQVIGISAGYSHSLALKQDGTLVAWGRDNWGQATAPGTLSGVVAVASAWDHNLALKQDGTVLSWGDECSTPTNVPAGLNGVIAVAVGQYHSLVLKGDGTIVAWGDNQYDQSTIPRQLSGTRVIGVAAGQLHSLALKEDGTVLGWGLTAVPGGLTGVVAVSAAYRHSLALKADGTVVAWGEDYEGETGPCPATDAIAIAAGAFHNLALKRDGTVVAWGSNDEGQTNVPSGLTGVVAIAAGAYHSMALKRDGTVAAWGYNLGGPTDVPQGLNSAVGIAGGYGHTVAIVYPCPFPPVLRVHPLTQTAEAGSTVKFSSRAEGVPALDYQWFFNGALHPAGTSSVLELTDLQSSQNGIYSVVVTNGWGSVTSAPAMLNVVALVERRPTAALSLSGAVGRPFFVETASALAPESNWRLLDNVLLTTGGQLYIDPELLSPQRFYRGWQTEIAGPTPTVSIHLVPTITLRGSIGESVRLDYINQFGPTNAWVKLGTVTLTNNPQLYFDTSAIGRPVRLYRLLPGQ